MRAMDLTNRLLGYMMLSYSVLSLLFLYIHFLYIINNRDALYILLYYNKIIIKSGRHIKA